MKVLFSAAKMFMLAAVLFFAVTIVMFVQSESFEQDTGALCILFAQLTSVSALAGIYCGVSSMEK